MARLSLTFAERRALREWSSTKPTPTIKEGVAWLHKKYGLLVCEDTVARSLSDKYKWLDEISSKELKTSLGLRRHTSWKLKYGWQLKTSRKAKALAATRYARESHGENPAYQQAIQQYTGPQLPNFAWVYPHGLPWSPYFPVHTVDYQPAPIMYLPPGPPSWGATHEYQPPFPQNNAILPVSGNVMQKTEKVGIPLAGYQPGAVIASATGSAPNGPHYFWSATSSQNVYEPRYHMNQYIQISET